MKFNMKYPILARYLTKVSKRRSGIKAGAIRFIVAHDTGNPGSTANGNVTYYERSRDEIMASAHLFVDDKEILECIPALTATPEKAWHVIDSKPKDNELYGCNANDRAIGVELCYGGRVNNQEAYARYVWVMAYICHTFNLNPLKDIVGHYTLDPERRSDPMTALKQLGKTFNGFLEDVAKELKECTAPSNTNKTQKEEDTMTLSTFQWDTLAKIVDNLLKEKIINSVEWKDKVANKSITISELAWLNSVVLDRMMTKK